MTKSANFSASDLALARLVRHQMNEPRSRFRRTLARGRYESSIAYRRMRTTAGALPTFLIIGAQKGGTTSLHEYLADHPDIGGSFTKEVHYFSLHSSRSLDWYRAHFPPPGRYQHVFESSPYYLFHPCCPGRIREALPDVKLIVLLRDPVDRAHSHHNHERALGFESLEFGAALDREHDRLDGEEERLAADPRYCSFAHRHYSYAARGMYAKQLKRWLGVFPRQQMLILASEDLFADPADTLHRVQSWLGLSCHTPTSLAARGARTYAPLKSQLHDELRSRFHASSASLAELTGINFPWA